MSREAAQAAFREAALAIDPERSRPDAPSSELVRAWLTVQTVRTQPRWLAAAEDAVMPIASGARTIPDDDVADWVATCCAGWVQRASGPFRAAAERLLPRLPESATAVPAWIGWWRITGRREARERALALSTTDARGAYEAWLATADATQRDRAVASVGTGPASWPLRAALGLDVDWDSDALAPLSPASRLLAVAPLAAPPVHLTVAWFIAEELGEGPMAEAATFPWPAMRFAFTRLPHRDQIRFSARLGDGPEEELEDVGVVAAWLEEITRAADRGPLLDGAPPRARRRGGLRRR